MRAQPCRGGLLTNDGSASPLHTACEHNHVGAACALLSAGAINDMAPLDLLPRSLHADVYRVVQLAKAKRGGIGADESRVGAPSAPAAMLLPPPHQSASQLQAGDEDGGEGSSEGPAGLSEASRICGRAASGRV